MTRLVTFGDHLKHARGLRGESLRAAATRIGCSHVYLGELERGTKHPSPQQAIRLAAALGWSPLEALARAEIDAVARVRDLYKPFRDVAREARR